MAFCLTKDKSKRFLQAIKSGKLDVGKLSEMTSAERVAKFSEIIGVDMETAKQVNALFESKLLLKYQKTGIKNWIQKTGNLKADAKRDLISRVNRMDKVLSPDGAFLEDLAAQRLGIGVTEEEAKQLFKLAEDVEKKGAKIEGTPRGSDERLEYGMAMVKFQDYHKELKIASEKKKLKDFLNKPSELIYEAGGAAKSLLASMDNSFFGRQGVKILFNSPSNWARNFAKSWKDIGKELIGRDALNPIKAEIFSRPNAVDGTYKKMKLAVGIDSEEAFPSSLPERIPAFGRLFKASESAYNGAALRMRADYADKMLKIAERNGVDTNNKEQLEAIGNLVNSMTGRGSIGKAETLSKEINALMFSIKYLKSNIDTITAHQFDPKATKFTKKQARKNLARIIAGLGSVYAMAYAANPDSVELDPRSTAFGKIRVGNRFFDITGGLSSLATLASRVTPTKHNGEWGLWNKSATGKWSRLDEAKFGQRNAEDVFLDFFTGKTAPAASAVRDLWRGQHFDRTKPTLGSIIKKSATPIPVQTVQDLTWEDRALDIATIIAEELGVGSFDITPKKK